MLISETSMPEVLYKVNTLDVRCVLEAALAQGVKRVETWSDIFWLMKFCPIKQDFKQPALSRV